MAKKATKKTDQPLTTAQRLGSLVKSARDIMRKDKGLNGDLDRLPMLTWVMFLKFLDDQERIEEERAKLKRQKFRPVIEAPYRWRDWAAKEDGISGDALRAFINNDEATRPDGTKGPGLIAYLRSLQGGNGDDRRDVVASVFSGVTNRMDSGYLLRDVINKIGAIHFDSTEEIHTLGHLYESMLKEMRDAAGDSGEFYTPRSVVRRRVEAMNPQLGVSGRRLQTPGTAVQNRRGPANPARTQHLWQRSQDTTVHAVSDEFAAARTGVPADHQRQQSFPETDRHHGTRTGGCDPDQSPVWWRRRKGDSGEFCRRQADIRNCPPLHATDHAEGEGHAEIRSRGSGSPQRSSLRGRSLWPNQAGTADEVQPAHGHSTS